MIYFIKIFYNRRGLALPVVMMVVICVMIMSASLIHFRKESKQQNVEAFQALRVNFLAQSAVQQLLLKLVCYPQDSYDAGVLGLGYCPFRGIVVDKSLPPPGKKDTKALNNFISDINTESIPWKIPGIKAEDNKFSIESLDVMSAYNVNLGTDDAEGGGKEVNWKVITANIVAIGEGKIENGNLEVIKEKFEKVVQLAGNK